MTLDFGSMVVGGLITLIEGGFTIYVLSELAYLRKKVNSLTPEALAKEIVKIKIPLNELPEDVANELLKMKANPQYNPAEKVLKPQQQSSYIG